MTINPKVIVGRYKTINLNEKKVYTEKRRWQLRRRMS